MPSNDDRFARSETITRYDPASERFGGVGQLGSGRGYRSATVPSDGRVLILGGEDHRHDFVSSALLDEQPAGMH